MHSKGGGGALKYVAMSNPWRVRSFVLGMSLVLFVFDAAHVRSVFAASPSTEGEAENLAKHALDAGKVSAFDGALTYVGQDVVANPAGGADHEITYTIAGPGKGVKSSVEYRIYGTPRDAAAHANPNPAQQKQEATEDETPHGQFRAYHSNLSGSDLARDVPETFRCIALAGKGSWSRCYYYPGGQSEIVVVGTTTSEQANEAIMITAMGAQPLTSAKP